MNNDPLTIKSSEFIKSIKSLKYRPEPLLAEFAFVGRSNVGKSSLINSLLQRKKLAKISSTPGKTQLVNYFLINNEFYFVDLPGYGFAKVSKKIKDEWQKYIEAYIVNNDQLKCLFLLMDARHGIKDNDFEMLSWLEHRELAYRIIFTKIDKLNRKKFYEIIRKSEKKYNVQLNNLFYPYSSTKVSGREEILKEINSFIQP